MIEISNQIPLAALTVGQFKELIAVLTTREECIETPATLNKRECCEFIGYSMNTINKLVSNREIPFYKNRGRVLFRRDELEDWLLSKRVETVDEYSKRMNNQLIRRS